MAEDPTLAQHLEQHVTSRLMRVARQLREIDSILQARNHGLLTRQLRAIPAPGTSAQPVLAISPASA
jgi:hypothetical protein